MSKRTCPHCGFTLEEGETKCPCGLDLEEIELPGPGIVRATAERQQAISPFEAADAAEDQDSKPKKPAPPAQSAEAPAPTPAPATPRADTPPKPAKPSRKPGARPAKDLLMECPACGARISKRAESCPKCGRPPFDGCQVCAARILAGSGSCPECGDPDPFLKQSA